EKLRRTRRVGENAAHGPCHEKNRLWSVRPKPIVHGCLIAQIEFVPCRQQEILEAVRTQVAHDSGPDQATMTRDIDTCGRVERYHDGPRFRCSGWLLILKALIAALADK